MLRNIDVSLDLGHCVHQLSNSIYAAVPFGIELLLIYFQPGLERRQATDDFFFSDFHGTAHRSFSRTAIQEGGLDEIFPAQKQAAALRAAKSFSTRKGVKVNSHSGVELGVIGGWYARRVVQQHRDLSIFGDRQLPLQFFAP